VQFRVVFHNVAGLVKQRPGTPWPRLDWLARLLPGLEVPFRSWSSLPAFFTRRKPDVLCLAEAPIDQHGNSPAVKLIAEACGLAHQRVDSCGVSHVASEGGHLGLAVLSRFPITHSDFVPFTDLGLGPEGLRYIKGVQRLRLELDQDTMVDLFNLHMPAVHIFGGRIEQFRTLRRELDEAVWGARHPGPKAPIVVTGDFNNDDRTLDRALPGTRLVKDLRPAITARTTVLGHPSQSDHILVSDGVTVPRSAIYWTTSDHAAVMADLAVAPAQHAGDPGH
jgi:endonuclease/exonuclease/phosphatase family metal-dependent hydrolase